MRAYLLKTEKGLKAITENEYSNMKEENCETIEISDDLRYFLFQQQEAIYDLADCISFISTEINEGDELQEDVIAAIYGDEFLKKMADKVRDMINKNGNSDEFALRESYKELLQENPLDEVVIELSDKNLMYLQICHNENTISEEGDSFIDYIIYDADPESDNYGNELNDGQMNFSSESMHYETVIDAIEDSIIVAYFSKPVMPTYKLVSLRRENLE